MPAGGDTRQRRGPTETTRLGAGTGLPGYGV